MESKRIWDMDILCAFYGRTLMGSTYALRLHIHVSDRKTVLQSFVHRFMVAAVPSERDQRRYHTLPTFGG